jgi:hypothetical protein
VSGVGCFCWEKCLSSRAACAVPDFTVIGFSSSKSVPAASSAGLHPQQHAAASRKPCPSHASPLLAQRSIQPKLCPPPAPGRGAFHGLHYAEVIEQVAIRGARPPIPEAAPPELRALMEACWQADPTKRPGFDALVTCLELLMAACGVRPDGSSTGSSAHFAGSGSHSGAVRSTSSSGRGQSRLSDGGPPSDTARRGASGPDGSTPGPPASDRRPSPMPGGQAVPLSTLDAAAPPLPPCRQGPQPQAPAWGPAAREQVQAAPRSDALSLPPRQQRLHPVGSMLVSQVPGGSGSIGTLGPTSGGPSSGLPSSGAAAVLPPGRRPSPAKPMESSSFVQDL